MFVGVNSDIAVDISATVFLFLTAVSASYLAHTKWDLNTTCTSCYLWGSGLRMSPNKNGDAVMLSPSSQPRSVSTIKAGFVDFINQHALGVPGRHFPSRKNVEKLWCLLNH